jgi:HK97 family phage portal protein
MTIRGSSISIVREDKPLVSPVNIPLIKSWAELEAFFQRERQSEGRQYKTNIPAQMQEYRGWVFSAIDCIVDRMGSVGYGFYRKDSGQELTTSSPYYRTITKPIEYPNDYMSFDFILQWCQVQLDLCGKACIYRKKNALGKTWELWPLDMNDFEGIAYENNNPDEKQINPLEPPQGFVFKIGEERLLFPPDNVIWLRYPHPESLWDGYSPIQSQAYITDIDYYLEVYERGFFQNSARIDFILEHEGNIGEDDAQRIKDMWTTAFSGAKRSYQPVVTGGGVRVVPINFSNKDFQFLELSNWTKDRILGCYRVPEGKLGLFGDINRANQKGLDITFNEEAIRPRLDLWDKEITKQLIWPEFSDKIVMKFDNPVPRDREMDLKELELREGKYTVNELRSWWEGAKPVAGGDVILIDGKLIPLTDAGKILPGDSGGDDRPGDSEETPDYDAENDPGGEESEKLIEHVRMAIGHDGWDRALEPVLSEYGRVLAHTNGWSYKKAEEYAVNSANIYMGDRVKDLFVDSVKYEMDRDQFRKRLVTLLVEQVAKRLDKPDSKEYEDISERMKRIEDKVSDRNLPSIVVDAPAPNRRLRKLKVVRDEDGFIAGLEEEEEIKKLKVVRDKDGLISGLEEGEEVENVISSDQEGDA